VSRLVINGFDDELHRRLKVAAAQQGTTVKDMLTAAARLAVDRAEADQALRARARQANPPVAS
jgi:plasmid stability protein